MVNSTIIEVGLDVEEVIVASAQGERNVYGGLGLRPLNKSQV